MTDLRYPIGIFAPQPAYSPTELHELIQRFAALPAKFARQAEALDEAGLLNRTYRPGGWTGLQVVHHLADSHLNAYQRIKLTLTEEQPTLRSYDEQQWALLSDYQHRYFVSLELLALLHKKLVSVLEPLPAAAWLRTNLHPTSGNTSTLAQLLAHYDWHGHHHLGHLELIAAHG